MKILFCVPGRNFSRHFLNSWTTLSKHCSDLKIKWGLINEYSPIVYEARWRCLQRALKVDYDYIMWIDSDMVFKPFHFDQLLKHEQDIVSGLYLMQTNGRVESLDTSFLYAGVGIDGKVLRKFDFMKENGEYQRELVEVRMNGMGWMLVKKGVFESIHKPFHYPTPSEVSKDVHKYLFDVNGESQKNFLGEDHIFQIKAMDAGFKSYVNPSIVLGHEKSFILR